MLTRGALLLLSCLGAACTQASPAPGSLASAAQGTADCPERYTDPSGRFSFCTPRGAKVSFTTSNDEHMGTFDYVYFAPKAGTTFTVIATARPYDFRGTEDVTFAGRPARHERTSHHEHSPASRDMLEDHRHVDRPEEDHDVTIERWAVATPSGGSIVVGMRTQEDTTSTAKSEVTRALATFQFVKPAP